MTYRGKTGKDIEASSHSRKKFVPLLLALHEMHMSAV